MARRAAMSAVALVGLTGRATGHPHPTPAPTPMGTGTGQNPTPTPTDDCSCMYQGSALPTAIYMNYPSSDPGKYKDTANIRKYGTMCAAWDQVPDTPWSASCPPGSAWADETHNWCQLPWCYVGPSCSSRIASSVFSGSQAAFYSYAACGNTPDCYNNFATASGCPYDPNGEGDYKLEKRSCACKFQGQNLPASLYDSYPSSQPGKYKNLPGIQTYGITCAAWDQSPDTPWYSSCPSGADWCAYDYNWCQAPWCYVDASCPTAIASSVFSGSSAAYFSYDTCLGSPDCYTNSAAATRASLPASCPFDKNDNGWQTAKACPSWTPEAVGAAAGTAISGAVALASAALYALAA